MLLGRQVQRFAPFASIRHPRFQIHRNVINVGRQLMEPSNLSSGARNYDIRLDGKTRRSGGIGHEEGCQCTNPGEPGNTPGSYTGSRKTARPRGFDLKAYAALTMLPLLA